MIEESKNNIRTNICTSLVYKYVLIADHEKKSQERLTKLLDEFNYNFKDIIISETTENSLQICNKKMISFAVINLNLPDGNALKIIQALSNKNKKLPILVISNSSSKEIILKAIQLGASGYLLKERNNAEVAMSIMHILQGGISIDPFLIGEILPNRIKTAPTSNKPVQELSTREIEILEFLTEGLNNQDIANKLGLSRYTIEAHLRNIYSKLSVDSRSKAIKIANSMGLF